MPAGIVTSDGKAYQMTGGLAANNNAKIIDFLGQTVTITGDVSEQHGMTGDFGGQRNGRRQVAPVVHCSLQASIDVAWSSTCGRGAQRGEQF